MMLGFIGVGQMGAGMVLNLLNAGHELTIFARRDSAAIDEIVESGAERADTLSALAGQVDAIILCVTGTEAARDVICGLLPGLSAGKLVIDTTTNEADGPQALASRL